MESQTILVTGGSGLVGSALRQLVGSDETNRWIFLSSRDGDLRNAEAVDRLFETHRPTIVIHLAANVGGLYKNMSQQVQMLEDNLEMNLTITRACHRYGVQDALFCLSTCIYPAVPPNGFPLHEDDLMTGPPHPSNECYAYAKRMLYLACKHYRSQYGRNYVCFSPVNLYGENDNYSLEDGHVLPAVLHKAYLASQRGEVLRLPGTGRALRQFLYAGDFARMIREWTARRFETDLLVCPAPERSINEAVRSITRCFEGLTIEYDGDETKDGIHQKTASDERFKKFYPDFVWSSFEETTQAVAEHFCRNYEKVRK